jgi:hypothetical protein
MLAMKTFARFFPLAFLPPFLVACVLEDAPPRKLNPQPYDSTPPSVPSGSGTVPGPVGSGTPSSSPMLVVIDTDQTMTADPGQGVGVFVEYAAGGKWTIWWTCDTAETGQSCDFVVSAAAQTGNISSVEAADLQEGTVTSPTPSRVEARIRTTNQLHGLSFSTAPGAIITVEASVGGLKDGSFLFFVQDNKVNGGYKGKLTNPLQLQGKTP